MKLKEEEIGRLNLRLEEHLKTIKKISNELTKSNNSSMILSTSMITNEKKDFSIGSDQIQNKMSSYEEEINNLRNQITDQKSNYEVSVF